MKATAQLIESLRQKALQVLKPSKTQLAHGLELHQQSVVCDSFGFMPSIWTGELFDRLNRLLDDGAGVKEWLNEATYFRFFCMTREQAAANNFVAALQAAGVNGLVHNVGGEGPLEASLPNLAARMHTCRVFSKYMFQAASVEEIRLAKTQSRAAVIFSLNGPVGNLNDHQDAFKWLQVCQHLGIRLMHLSYNRRNHIAGGCMEEQDDGLSDFGREYVRKMNAAGMLVDTPHSSRQTTLDAAKFSSKPIMASHIGVKALFDHPRCKTDEELKAIAGTGGLVGIYNYPNMLGRDGTIAALLDHVDAAVKLIGPEHVSIGTDVSYCPGVWPPKNVRLPPALRQTWERDARAGGWKKEHFRHTTNEHIEGSLAWTNWPLFTVGLVMRGYKDRDIKKIIGENFLRVLEANRPEPMVKIA